LAANSFTTKEMQMFRLKEFVEDVAESKCEVFLGQSGTMLAISLFFLATIPN
jgi:hypothetical protein